MADLSPRQKDVLDYISHTIESRGLPPSYREIGDALNIASTNGVSDHVKALIRKGFVKKLDGPPGGVARGLQLIVSIGTGFLRFLRGCFLLLKSVD